MWLSHFTMTLRCANRKEIVKRSNVVGDYGAKEAINTGKLSKILVCHPELGSGSWHRYIIPPPENIKNITSASHAAKRHVRGDFVPQKESKTEWLVKILCHPEFISGSCPRNIIPPPENINNISFAFHTAKRHVRGDYVPQKESKTGWLVKILCHPELRILCRVRTESETRSSANKSECERSAMNDLFAWNNNPRHVSGSCNRNIIPSPENIKNIPSASCTAQRHVRGDYVPQKESKTGWLVKILCHPEFISGSSHRDLGSITESLINHRHIEPPTEGLLLCKYSQLTLLYNREIIKANVREGSERDSELKSGNAEAFQSINRSNQRHKALKINSKFFFFGSLFLFSCLKKEKVNKEQTISKVLCNKLKRQVRGGYATRKAAFTLAEVLITLGIIGVVAAMTMPTLITNYQKNVTVTRLKKFYTTFSQAHLRAEEANGAFGSWTLADDNSTRDDREAVFEKYYKPYMNVSRCDSSCAPEFFKQLGIDDNRLVYQLSDGSLFLFEPSQFTASANPNVEQWIYIVVDINGDSKPNMPGRDIFHLDIYPKYGLVMLGRFGEEEDTLKLRPSTRDELINGVSINGGTSTAYCNNGTAFYSKHTCGALIQMDGWQIKEDYPW